MIPLHPKCLMPQMAAGEAIPCSAGLVSVELIGEAAGELDPEHVAELRLQRVSCHDRVPSSQLFTLDTSPN